MKFSVVPPGELGPEELLRWREIQRSNRELRNPFLSPDFTVAVGRVRPKARVAVMEQDGRIVGFFPHEIRGLVIGKPIGAGISDCQAVVHEPGLDWSLSELMRACRLPVWEFDHLLASQRAFQQFHANRTTSPTIDLSEGYDAYVAERRRATNSSFKKVFQWRRRLERAMGPLRMVYDVPSTDTVAMEQLALWKSAQYVRTGHFDRFATPWISSVLDDLRATRTGECAGTLSVAYAGDEIVGVDFGLRGGDILTSWFTAYNPELGRYSPGTIVAILLAEAAAGADIRCVDMGKGDSEFKKRVCNASVPVAEGRVVRSQLVAGTRRAELAMRGYARRLRRVPYACQLAVIGPDLASFPAGLALPL